MLMNLTPHDINVILFNGEQIIYPKTGRVLRAVSSAQADLGFYEGVPVVSEQKFIDVEGLPEDYTGSILVSALVAPLLSTYPGRVFVPDTGPTSIRDASGKILGVRRLIEFFKV